MNRTVLIRTTTIARTALLVDTLASSGTPHGRLSVVIPQGATFEDAPDIDSLADLRLHVVHRAGPGVLAGPIGHLPGFGGLRIADLGLALVAGPLMNALSSSSSGPALPDLRRTLIQYGFPELGAVRCVELLRSGEVLTAVHSCSSQERRGVLEICKSLDASHIDTSSDTPFDRALEHCC